MKSTIAKECFELQRIQLFLGDSVENFLDDRRLFIDAFYRFYTDFEPEHRWVSCVEGQVVGFLVGCNNRSRQVRILVTKLLPQLALNLARGRYLLGKKTRQYLSSAAATLFRPEFLHVNPRIYPVHFHLNLDRRWRRNGLGRCLCTVFLKQLVKEEITGVLVHTTDYNESACKFFQSLGFETIAN